MNKSFFLGTFFMVVFALGILSDQCVLAQKKKKEKADRQANIHVLLVDGQSKNHAHWKEWTPVLLKQLDDAGLFRLNVATAPIKGESLDKFNPKFKNYDVVISTYDGDNWSMRTKRNLEKYIEKGGGLVVIHAADNAFADWENYNTMIGLAGWGDRTQSAGPYVYIDNKGETIRDTSPGNAGHHGPQHEYLVEIRAPEHPIMKDLPSRWLHAEDELYDHLRGPAINLNVLATAYSDERHDGSLHHEPVLMAITYGSGRVFHTTMGHDRLALSCVGFMTTFIRGCEWAANRQVSFEVPPDFPKERQSSVRAY
ncbi:MAG: ThuA domain-containing protein [Cyclobacteriaceae bacterium]|nr:ThuA domain-containing protein [Cyclobacteriaceae bacterium]